MGARVLINGIRCKPKSSENGVVLTISGGKSFGASAIEATSVGEIVIKPKSSDSFVVLTINGGEPLKASIWAKPEREHMATREPMNDTVVFAPTP